MPEPETMSHYMSEIVKKADLKEHVMLNRALPETKKRQLSVFLRTSGPLFYANRLFSTRRLSVVTITDVSFRRVSPVYRTFGNDHMRGTGINHDRSRPYHRHDGYSRAGIDHSRGGHDGNADVDRPVHMAGMGKT